MTSFHKCPPVTGISTSVLNHHVATSSILEVVCFELMESTVECDSTFFKTSAMETHVFDDLFAIDPETRTVVGSGGEDVLASGGDEDLTGPFGSKVVLLKVLRKFSESSFVWKVDLAHGFDEIWFDVVCFVSFSVGSFLEIPELSDETVWFLGF